MNTTMFTQALQNAFIERHSEVVEYFPARKCSCSKENDPNRSDPNCAVCLGLGYFYRTSTKVRGIVTGIASQKMLMEAGIALPGDMVFSQKMSHSVPMTDMDMIRMTWTRGEPFEGEVLMRGSGAIDTLTYIATDVLDVFSVDAFSGAITTYVNGTDYVFVPRTNTITWQAVPSTPAAGQRYGIKYNAIFDWVVFAPPAQRVERGTPLGNRVILRKKHLVLAR